MAIFRRRTAGAPRLAPELDDAELGRVLRALPGGAAGAGPQDILMARAEQLLRDAGTDWDRRGHRVTVLAGAAPSLARRWRLRDPGSADALVLHAWADVLNGRLTGRLDDTAATLDTCRRAADAAPADPTPWVALLAALCVERRTSAALAPVWEEIAARDPWNRDAYLTVFVHLSPDGQGSQAAQREFLDDVLAVMPPHMPPVCLPLAAAVGQYHRELGGGGLRALLAARHWEQPQNACPLDRAAAQWLRPGYLRHAARVADLNLLAYALAVAGRTEEAGRAFEATENLVCPWPWRHEGDPVERYAHWRGRCG
ncbi:MULTISPECIES: hypothetical protein [Streptomyces]|uniref:DUF4034 domain-containing protein n=2 Tax=Streptomyces TaxID=1883 RepID=A0A3M8F8B1_9ACTN|nr:MULTISPECIES: hypothetical protein [Streptomyces]KNE84230.1 hypothetical protein ADZ36_00455 [Streptomyces fradiae]OFA58541.1 hypothetical protein BEN35_03680 [Streptomyces fradiae]PQM22079.1 hypothetical protein Sfr7A_17605 [Streptomyces xinghaiensis]RKM95330.1 hypothetical protein SFRA_014730 [Streptomyces xinghaiensis]RNC72914.1 hypothetical protein DC095_017155 [Streptomyces xinghaiensis]